MIIGHLVKLNYCKKFARVFLYHSVFIQRVKLQHFGQSVILCVLLL